MDPDLVMLETPAGYDVTIEGAEEAYLKNHIISLLKFVGTIYLYTHTHTHTHTHTCPLVTRFRRRY
jgi:hypothetical protein